MTTPDPLATPEALAAWLQERPDFALEVVDRLRLAEPWTVSPGFASRGGMNEFSAAVVERVGRRWTWRCWLDEEKRAPSRREAMRRADEQLRGEGVGLGERKPRARKGRKPREEP